MSEMVRFAILGTQRAWYGDRELDLGPGKQRAVLAVLLLSVGRPVSTSRIVDAVWPGDPPANGANVVQKHIAGLRRVLEPERSPRTPGQVLSLTDAGYLLRVGPDTVDAVRFERGVRRAQQWRAEGRTADAVNELKSMLELWHGEPFTGFSGPVFDAARQRLVETRGVALETWADLELRLGRHRELIGDLVKLVAEFPTREQLRQQLMLALHRSGRQAEALTAYREIRALLHDEYGLEPGDALQELHRRILRSDPTLLTPQPILMTPQPPAEVPAVVSEAVAPPSLAPVPYPRSAAGSPPFFPAPPMVAGPVGAHPYGTGRRRPPWRAPLWVSRFGTVVGTAITLLSFGLLTWLVMLIYAIWRRSWRLAVAAAGYLVSVSALIYLLERPEEPTSDAFLFLGLIVVCWPVGAVHVLLLTRGVWAAITGAPGDREDQAVEDHRVRREQARYLLYHYPAARYELRIGRPDLPRTFDDGGLIDINMVPDHVLAVLPGLMPEQCRQVTLDRWLRGPYSSMEELAGRCLLPATLTDSLREFVVFLPVGDG